MRRLSLLYSSLYLRGIALFLCSLCLLIVPTQETHASQISRSIPASAQIRQATANKSVTILVLDMSGSMSRNDPQGLRCSAARAFIDLSGPGDFIGLVDLDGTGTNGGAHNFEQTQNWSSDVLDMSTVQERNHLKDTLNTQSHNCQPHADTPTYDALNKALNMLEQVTQGNAQGIAGSVLLLTDGEPYPDTTGQYQAIKSELFPQFQQHNWPVYTVALGQDETTDDPNSPFHSAHEFLKNFSDATVAKAYDDSQGEFGANPPLNIAPFFVDVFARQNHRTVNEDIPETTAPSDRNFVVTRYTDILNIVVVKDTASATVVLKDPQGNSINGRADITSSSDDYYAVFSINQPQEGNWILSVSGGGEFLMKSLKTSEINLANTTLSQNDRQLPTLSTPLAIGQPVTVNAQLVDNGATISDNSFSLSGTISKDNAAGTFTTDVAFNSTQTPGTYRADFTIPENQPGGTYTLNISVANGSLATPISGQQISLTILRFPEPILLSPQTHQPVQNGNIEATAVNWGALGTLYDLPVIQWFRQWPLAGEPAELDASFDGQFLYQNQLYSGATISAVNVVLNGTTQSIAAQVTNNGNGTFHLFFPVTQDGDYSITFQVTGSFTDSFGSMGTFQRMVHVKVRGASSSEISQAIGVTCFYLLCLLLLFFLLRYMFSPHPFGSYQSSQGGEESGSFEFKRAGRGPLALFRPNLVYSREAKMPRGLVLRFIRGGSIEVRPDGNAGKKWLNNGRELSSKFQNVSELWFSPPDGSNEEMTTYTIQSASKQTTADNADVSTDWDWT